MSRRRRSQVQVHLTIEVDDSPLPGPRVEAAVRAVLSGENVPRAEVGVAVIDNSAIREMNARFLQHDYATDVISFRLDDGDGGNGHEAGGADLAAGVGRGVLEGEIAVSAEMARQMAPRYGWGADDELLLYILHGALHLVGYDDLDDAAREIMREREAHYLQLCGASPAPGRDHHRPLDEAAERAAVAAESPAAIPRTAQAADAAAQAKNAEASCDAGRDLRSESV